MTVEIRAAVLTASDRSARGERGDESGPVLAELLREAGATVVAQEVVSDELEPLAGKLRELSDRADVNLVVTTGGTGLGPRDNTPEATRAVLEREAPGIAEAMRAETLRQTPTAMLSRAATASTRAIDGEVIIPFPSATLLIEISDSPSG